jgi:molecular chaperone DnaJ
VQVNVWTPQHLNEQEKEVLEKLSKSENLQPNPEKTEKGFFDKLKDLFS